MIVERQASAIIILSIATGIFLSPAVDYQKTASFVRNGFSSPQEDESSGEEFDFGTANEYALFKVVVNGSEKNLSAERFRKRSEYVRLERDPGIVHKYAEGVDWDYFLETINTSVGRNGSGICVSMYEDKWCGEGEIVLNGVETYNLSREISQGDKLLVIVDTKNSSAVIEKYSSKELPEPYRFNRFERERV